MNRRRFLQTCAAIGAGVSVAGSRPLLAAGGRSLAWRRDPKTRLFTGVSADGMPLVADTGSALLEACCRIAGEAIGLGPLRLTVTHRLCDSGAGQGEDMLEAGLTIRNTSDRSQRVEVEFTTSARLAPSVESQHVYVPLSAAGLLGDGRFAALGVKNFLKDCDHSVGTNDFTAHYLEPMASYAAQRETQALLLAPVVDVFDAQRLWRISLFTASDEPMQFSSRRGVWHASREITISPGGTIT